MAVAQHILSFLGGREELQYSRYKGTFLSSQLCPETVSVIPCVKNVKGMVELRQFW